MNHLGHRVTALVDGELAPGPRERALAHAAGCADCRAALDAERRAKAQVSTLGDPLPPPDLSRRLLALGEPGNPLPARGRPMPGAPRAAALPPPGRPDRTAHGARPGRGAPDSRAPGRRRLRVRRGSSVAGGVLSVAGLALGGAFLLGGAQEPTGPALLPPVNTFSQEHATTVNHFPFADPAFGAVQMSRSGSYGPTFSPLLVRGVPFR